MRCLAYYVTHLKAVKGDKHAIKNLDRELECKTCCLAKAAGVEAVVPCKCAAIVAFHQTNKSCTTAVGPNQSTTYILDLPCERDILFVCVNGFVSRK